MESLENIFERFASTGDFFQTEFSSEIIRKNLIPYFLRRGMNISEATSKSYLLMAYLIGKYNQEMKKKNHKIGILEIKNIRKDFASGKKRPNLYEYLVDIIWDETKQKKNQKLSGRIEEKTVVTRPTENKILSEPFKREDIFIDDIADFGVLLKQMIQPPSYSLSETKSLEKKIYWTES